MKAFGIIALIISLVIVAVIAGQQRKAEVKSEITKLPEEVNTKLNDFNKESERRIDEGQEPE